MNKRQTGTDYERQAAGFLEEKGYHILESNFRCRAGEIDLIAEKDGWLVFVEVKYRRDQRFGSPFEAVTKRKQQRICRAARWYLAQKQYPEDTRCRFDVVGICGNHTEILVNAFDL
ncbi:MAG: YraN family protein [Candidatus Limivivens sp.]|nr:YraN family protein [Candidatus Limivivens sp.]